MERLTAPATDALWQRLEALATELEQTPSAYAFSPWVLLAEAFAATRPPVATLPAIRRSVALAHRLRAIRTNLLPHELPWRPLTDVLALVHTEATRLSTLYGVARPACLLRRREQRQAFHTAFTVATGTAYHTYDAPKTAKARTTITTFWADACTTALAAYQAAGTLEALDGVLAGLPAWSAQHPVRWGPRGWREPAPPEVMQRLTTYLPGMGGLRPGADRAGPGRPGRGARGGARPGGARHRGRVRGAAPAPAGAAQCAAAAQGRAEDAARPAAQGPRPGPAGARRAAAGARGGDHAAGAAQRECAAEAGDVREAGARLSRNAAAEAGQSQRGRAAHDHLDL